LRRYLRGRGGNRPGRRSRRAAEAQGRAGRAGREDGRLPQRAWLLMAGELILYTTEDGDLVVRLQERDGSVWLTQSQMAELFQTTVSNINKHIKGILDDGEQDEATIEEYSIVQTEGGRTVERLIAHYSLPMILAVGFRVRSPRGAQFRRWAAETL